VLDPADPAVAAMQQEQADRFVRLLDNATTVGGVLIDRVDWTGLINTRPGADDGVSWYDPMNAPGRLLLRSFLEATTRLQSTLDRNGQQVWMSPKVYRPDMIRTADGMYDESGDFEQFGAVTSILGVGGKPLSAWFGASPNRGNPTDDPGLRRYLQGLLHAGVLPTVPFPMCDHCVQPNATTASVYLEYLPLFRLLMGRAWLLTPNAAMVSEQTKERGVRQGASAGLEEGIEAQAAMAGAAAEGGRARTNAFTIDFDPVSSSVGGRGLRVVVPIIGGLSLGNTTLTVTLPPGTQISGYTASVVLPGDMVGIQQPIALKSILHASGSGDVDELFPVVSLNVSLGKDGCAVAVLQFV